MTYDFDLGGDTAARAWRTFGPQMNAALDVAYEALLWISEYPNRVAQPKTHGVQLAEYAREALFRVEMANRGFDDSCT